MSDTPQSPTSDPAEAFDLPDVTDWRRYFWRERRARLILISIGVGLSLLGLIWRIVEANKELEISDE